MTRGTVAALLDL